MFQGLLLSPSPSALSGLNLKKKLSNSGNKSYLVTFKSSYPDANYSILMQGFDEKMTSPLFPEKFNAVRK